MELDFDGSVVRGLHRYVCLVNQALGLPSECFYVQADTSIGVYLALDGRLDGYPDRDVALLWDENRGWTAAIEMHGGEDMLVVAGFDEDVLPPPKTVATWVRNLFTGMGPANPPAAAPAPAGRTRRRLAAYTTDDAATEPHPVV
jgi:hypothetical protein